MFKLQISTHASFDNIPAGTGQSQHAVCRMMASAWTQETNAAIVEEFLRCLAVCHTVIPDGGPPLTSCWQQSTWLVLKPDTGFMVRRRGSPTFPPHSPAFSCTCQSCTIVSHV